MLRGLARATGSEAIAGLSGAGLLGERAAINQWRIEIDRSAGGGCILYEGLDDRFALNLARPDDRGLLPALFEMDDLAPADDAAISRLIGGYRITDLLPRARILGLAAAAESEFTHATAETPGLLITQGAVARAPEKRAPRILDFSALWAGPLTSHLMQMAGAEVIKVESRSRLDGMREGDKDFFALLNQGKASVMLDFAAHEDRALLRRLIHGADIVIEASRPRALLSLGIDATAIIREQPGLVWLTITAHGVRGAASEWVGFGDDCGVAAGLSAALRAATGVSGFVADAIGDPLTGLHAALTGWTAWRDGAGGRYAFSLRGAAQAALQAARSENPAGLDRSLKAWAAARGALFPNVLRRPITLPVAASGADNARILSALPSC